MADLTPAQRCTGCSERIVWARTPLNKSMPLDPAPDADGNVAAYRDGTGRWRARVLLRDEKPLGYERRHMPHFATCAARKATTSGVCDG